MLLLKRGRTNSCRRKTDVSWEMASRSAPSAPSLLRDAIIKVESWLLICCALAPGRALLSDRANAIATVPTVSPSSSSSSNSSSIGTTPHTNNRCNSLLNPFEYKGNHSGTMAVDGWAVTFGTSKRGLAWPQPAQAPHRCTKCNSPHQRPVNQSPCCCIVVRCSTVLMCP